MLNRRAWVVKERIGFLKLADRYDILDPETGGVIGFAIEELNTVTKWLRLLVHKRRFPTRVEIRESVDAPPLLVMSREVSRQRAEVSVYGRDGAKIGCFRSTVLGGGLHVFDKTGQEIAEVKRHSPGWNYHFLGQKGKILGSVTKRLEYLAKELLTSADTYVITLADGTPSDNEMAGLMLAAGLTIDMVFHE